jgi:hypothetical protein
MKCRSKKILNYKEEQLMAERARLEAEKVAKMSPEEREAYEANKRKKVENFFKNLALVNDIIGPNKY